MSDDLFERAFAGADIEAVAGVKLYRAGRQMRGECPLCGASKGKKAGGAFSVETRSKVFKCFACNEGGDVIKLEHLLNGRGGEGLRDAAARLAGETFVPAQGFAQVKAERPRRAVRQHAEVEADDQWKAEMASRLWREAYPARGTLVETYLRARGITGRVLDLALGLLRFHPSAYHSGRLDRPRTAGAMIGLVMVIGASRDGHGERRGSRHLSGC